MKKKTSGDLMQDPFYSQIMFRIEKLIFDQDRAAQAADLRVTDTNAKSAIHKALSILKGKSQKEGGESLKDQWIRETAKGLVVLGKALCAEDQVETAQFSKALLAVEDSLKTRRELYGDARGYLDFLKRFIEEQSLM